MKYYLDRRTAIRQSRRLWTILSKTGTDKTKIPSLPMLSEYPFKCPLCAYVQQMTRLGIEPGNKYCELLCPSDWEKETPGVLDCVGTIDNPGLWQRWFMAAKYSATKKLYAKRIAELPIRPFDRRWRSKL